MARGNRLANPQAKAALEQFKYEIASELGLSAKIDSQGWDSLTTKEAGSIGGLMVKRMIERSENNL